MSGKLLRVTEKLYNTPHIITQEKLSDIFDYLESRNNEEIVNEAAVISNTYEAAELLVEDGVAILHLEGPTTYRETGWEAFCGGISYQSVVRNIDTIVSRKDEINLVVAFIDSPGGEAYRAFETGRYIREALQGNGIKSVAYVDGMSASGGYVLASAFDEVVSNPDSEIGSIGVRIALRNPSKEERERTLYITAGDNKVPFDAEGKFKDEFIQKLQKGVNETYDTFVNYVADLRGMTREAVIDTKADTFSANESLSRGLVDKVMDGNSFVNYVADLKDLAVSGDTNLRQISEDVIDKELSVKDSPNGDDSVSVNADINVNVEELSSQDNNENGDTMSEQLSLEQVEAMIAEKLNAQKVELEAAQAEEVSTLKATVEELNAAKVAAEEAAAAELAKKQAEIDAQDKAKIEDFVKGLSFAGASEEKEQLTEALFKNRSIEGFESVISVLGKAQEAVDSFDVQKSVESVEDEAIDVDSDQKALIKAIESAQKRK